MNWGCVCVFMGDHVYRSVVSFIKFFSKGWGPVETYEGLAKILLLTRSKCRKIIEKHSHPITVKKVSDTSNSVSYDGVFLSPLATLIPGLLPKEAETARFELLIPKKWKGESRPLYIHMAGTGDHFFWRRRFMYVYPLLKSHGIGSVILENPFYGTRKPRNQTRSQLLHVSDLFVMGLALIFECLRLGQWLEEQDLGPIGLTGLSMGGHNASLTACLWPKPVAVVPCLSWSTASSVFTEGALSSAVCWDVLEEQLFYAKLGHNVRMKRMFEIASKNYQYTSDINTSTEHYSTYDGPANLLNEEEAHRTILKPQSPEITKLKTKIRNNESKKKQVFIPKAETVNMMRWMFDYATHLQSYPCPIAPELAIFLTAKWDMYIPRLNVTDVRDLWPGCEVRYHNGGHVSSHILNRTDIRQALADGMDKLLNVYSRNGNQSLA